MWKPTELCVKLHAPRDEQVPMGPVHRLAINFSLTPELARSPTVEPAAIRDGV